MLSSDLQGLKTGSLDLPILKEIQNWPVFNFQENTLGALCRVPVLKG